MSIKLAKYKPVRLLEIDLTGNEEKDMLVLVSHVNEFSHLINGNSTMIIEELKAGNYENMLAVFDFYFGDDIILYR